ncbi:hypothetical protein [Duganella sp. BJB475]|uniref:hypothetical protein n=1 Tax=Duganella sp. BJB475 TaxID=2233914 RepID=UPI000E3528C6|nr:hypothetical protein [Duganella sp. BJB475]RFP19144.1 hypothetical protein D0T23_05015 [Duganella sp. BJB475]
MRRTALLTLALIAGTASAGCVPLDYQEMKEMKPDDLMTELCAARSQAKAYIKDADDSTIYGSRLSGYGSNAEVDEAYAKGDSLRELSKACAGQALRMERILVAAGTDLEVIKQRCSAPKAAAANSKK